MSTHNGKPPSQLLPDAASLEAYWRSEGRLFGQLERPAGAPIAVRTLPPIWTFWHVMERVQEAYETLRRVPIATRPRGFSNTMPAYAYERGDLNAQLETYELEKLMQQRNEVRIPAKPRDIARMDQAFGWMGRYLVAAPEEAKALQLDALWTVQNLDIGAKCRARGLTRRIHHRRRDHALQVVSTGLNRDRVEVT